MPTFFLDGTFPLPTASERMAPPPQEIEETVRRLAEGIAASEGCDLVDLEILRGGRKWIVRIFIDTIGGVSAEDCATVSRQLGTVLEVENLIPQKYVLEVSSPGMDRPLRTPKDFHRNLGRLLRVRIASADPGPQHHRGKLLSIGDQAIVLETEEGEPMEILLEKIQEAKVLIDWRRPPAGKGDRKA